MNRRGFTLIELLIVVAIISIMSAASLIVITGPMQENAFASIDHARQAGESTLFARLVEDAHSATRVAAVEPGKLVLERAGDATTHTVTYQVDDRKQLRRHVGAAGDMTPGTAAGAALLENVESFSAEALETGSNQYRVRVACATTRYARKLGDAHELVIGIGSASWNGEAHR